MALIECSECSKEVSDKAAACPHCGAPVQSILNNSDVDRSTNQTTATAVLAEPSSYPIKLGIIGCIIVLLAEILQIIAIGTHNLDTISNNMILAVLALFWPAITIYFLQKHWFRISLALWLINGCLLLVVCLILLTNADILIEISGELFMGMKDSYTALIASLIVRIPGILLIIYSSVKCEQIRSKVES